MELEQAEWLDMMCRRYHCLPSQILAEDSSIMQMLHLIADGEGVPDGQ